jgi:hypothetical protein
MNKEDLVQLGMAYTYKQAGFSDTQAIKIAAKVNFSKIMKGFDDLTRPNLPVVRGNTLPATTPYKPNFVTGPITPDPKKAVIRDRVRLLLEAKKGPAPATPIADTSKLTGKDKLIAGGVGLGSAGVAGGTLYGASKLPKIDKVEARPG